MHEKRKQRFAETEFALPSEHLERVEWFRRWRRRQKRAQKTIKQKSSFFSLFFRLQTSEYSNRLPQRLRGDFFFLRFICLESTKTTGENSVFKILTNFPNAHRTVRAQNRTRTQQIYISVQKRTNRISESFFLFLFILYSDKFAQQQKTVRESQNRKIHAFTR